MQTKVFYLGLKRLWCLTQKIAVCLLLCTFSCSALVSLPTSCAYAAGCLTFFSLTAPWVYFFSLFFWQQLLSVLPLSSSPSEPRPRSPPAAWVVFSATLSWAALRRRRWKNRWNRCRLAEARWRIFSSVVEARRISRPSRCCHPRRSHVLGKSCRRYRTHSRSSGIHFLNWCSWCWRTSPRRCLPAYDQWDSRESFLCQCETWGAGIFALTQKAFLRFSSSLRRKKVTLDLTTPRNAVIFLNLIYYSQLL